MKMYIDENFSSSFDQLEKARKLFLSELAGQRNLLNEMVSEAPEEYKEELAKELLRVEVEYCISNALTYDKHQRINDFPYLTSYINGLMTQGSESHNIGNSITLTQTTCYETEKSPWRRGGQGTIHRAKESSLAERELVIKVLSDSKFKSQFEKEALVTAKLDHPGIVSVFMRGEMVESDEEGHETRRPFYSMRLIRGETLEEEVHSFHDWRKKNGVSRPFQSDEFNSLIERLVSACDTVEYAHSRHILHCDLKPSNINCGQYHATFVLDWGSATNFNTRSETGEANDLFSLSDWTSGGCTREFASVEQLDPKNNSPLTPMSDVYSLGATLYFLLTGKAPHRHSREAHDIVSDPRLEVANMPRQIAAICLKATSVVPKDRYSSAKEFGDDLRQWLRGESIDAAPDTFVEKSFKFMLKHKAMSIALTLFALTVASLATLILVQRAKQAKTIEGRDTAFGLINKIVSRMERDEVTSNKEFKNIANDLEEFSNEYIALVEYAEDQKDHNLAQAYEIKAVVNKFNYDNQQSSQLQVAIDNLKKAQRHFPEKSVVDLGICQIHTARLELLKAERQKNGVEQIELARSSGLEALSTLSPPSDSAPTDLEHLFSLAEANHLLGEIYLRFRNQNWVTAENDSCDPIYYFEQGRDIRLKLKKVFDGMTDEQQNRMLRDLGRSYGYLGDAYQYQSRLEDALGSYEESLKFRKGLAKKHEADEEYQLQLARGYSNFSFIARDQGDKLRTLKRKSDNENEFLTKLRESKDEPELFVDQNYSSKALEIRERLAEKHDDKRFLYDLGNSLNFKAELHLFLALEELEDRESALDDVKQTVGKLNRAFEKFGDKSETELAVRQTLAIGEMIKLQALCLEKNPSVNEIETTAEGICKLVLPDNEKVEDLEFAPLLAYTVAKFRENDGVVNEKTKTHIKKLKSMNPNAIHRLEMHFGKENVE